MQLKQLLDIQDIDNHILRIKAELADIPRQIALHQSKLNTAQAEEKALTLKVETVTKDRHAKELDLKTKEEEIKKYSTQLSLVKTNDQYKALLHEISDAKSKISKLEDNLLEAMDVIDKSKENLAKYKTIVQQEQAKFKELEIKFNSEIARLENLLKEANDKRKSLVDSVRPELLRIYNRISMKWSGSALATIQGNVCQGCSMTLPPQVIHEVKKNDHIVQCESCSRILYLSESETI
jgi:predicted  nucleic acid-binding Zn-ribbon protein